MLILHSDETNHTSIRNTDECRQFDVNNIDISSRDGDQFVKSYASAKPSNPLPLGNSANNCHNWDFEHFVLTLLDETTHWTKWGMKCCLFCNTQQETAITLMFKLLHMWTQTVVNSHIKNKKPLTYLSLNYCTHVNSDCG